MRTAHFSRCEQARFCAVAQAAKAGRDLGKSQIDVPFDVLCEDRGWPDFVDDPLDFGPQVPGIAPPAALPGQAERLARISGSEDMNAVTPRAAVEGSQIVPDRRSIQRLVVHPRHESGRGMGFPLDETCSAISGVGDGNAELEAAISGAQRESVKGVCPWGTYNHNDLLLRRLSGRSEKGSTASIC